MVGAMRLLLKAFEPEDTNKRLSELEELLAKLAAERKVATTPRT
jgi:hypothetical protein